MSCPMVQAVPRKDYAGERQFLVVHPYDGLLAPLDPKALEQVITDLVSRVATDQVDYVIGLDGPGAVPAVVVSQITGKPLRLAVKANLEVGGKVCFKEPGSVNPVFLYNLVPGRVILVDDEIRSGRTVEACIEAIKSQGVEVVAVIVPVGSRKFRVQELFERKGIRLYVAVWHEF